MVDCSAAGRAEAQSIPDLLRQWPPTGLIAHVHLSDPNHRGSGEGDLPFAPILRALADGGYAGAVAVEPFLRRPRHWLRARPVGSRPRVDELTELRGYS